MLEHGRSRTGADPDSAAGGVDAGSPVSAVVAEHGLAVDPADKTAADEDGHLCIRVTGVFCQTRTSCMDDEHRPSAWSSSWSACTQSLPIKPQPNRRNDMQERDNRGQL